MEEGDDARRALEVRCRGADGQVRLVESQLAAAGRRGALAAEARERCPLPPFPAFPCTLYTCSSRLFRGSALQYLVKDGEGRNRDH